MLLLGLLSILQVAFLPGYLMLRSLKLDRDLICVLVWSFALSLVINHFLVAGLVVLKIYRGTSLYLIFAAEVALFLGWTLPNVRRTTVADTVSTCVTRLKALRQVLPEHRDDKGGILRCTLLGGAVLVTAGYGISGLMNVGQIFSQWDAVVSWNRWAIDWAANRLPVNTREYPQLLPANWSITYVFIQDASVWFFAKALMPLFCFLILLATVGLYKQTRDAGYLCGTMLIYWLFVAILRFRTLASGHAELPVAFFAFASVYALLVARQTDEEALRTRYVMLGAVLAAGAALTKQAGLFMVGVYPLLAWLMVLRSDRLGFSSGTRWPRLLPLVQAGLLCVAITAPWYLYKQIEIRAGQDSEIVSYLLVDIHRGRGVWERFTVAGEQMLRALSIPGAGVLVVLLAASLRDPLHRWLTALIVVPSYVVWSIGFSYDARNVALAIPFAGMAAGIGARRLAEAFSRIAARYNKNLLDWTPNLLHLRVMYLVIVLAAVAGILSRRITRADLLARQLQLQRSVGLPEVNEQLYAYDARAGIDGKIVTDYWILRWLPGLQEHHCSCPMNDLAAFQALWNQSAVQYAFVCRATACPEVLSYVDSACRQRMMQTEVECAGYRLHRNTGAC